MKIALEPFANGIVTACALIGLGVLLGRARTPGPRTPPEQQQLTARDWAEVSGDGASIGPASAPAVFVTFSDFQCPFCAEFASEFNRLSAAHPGRARLVYRHFPLDAIHPHAREAALAAECARRQGRFAAMHDALFAGQDAIGGRSWDDYAAKAGLDRVAFGQCMEAGEPKAAIERDVALGERLGVTGTPTIYFDGKPLRGAPTLERLESLVAR